MDEIGDDPDHGLRQEGDRFLRAFAHGQGLADDGVIEAARVVLLVELDPLLHLVQPQIDRRHPSIQDLLADLRVRVLAQQEQGLLQKRHGAPKYIPVAAVEPVPAVQGGTLVDDPEGVGILLEGLLRLGEPHPILLAAVLLQPLHGGVQAVILHLIPQQHVHGGVEEVRHLHNELDVRHGEARLPLVDGAGRDPQHLGKLLLGQRPHLPEGPDVLRQLHVHSTPPCFSLIRSIHGRRRLVNRPFILLGYIFLYCQ